MKVLSLPEDAMYTLLVLLASSGCAGGGPSDPEGSRFEEPLSDELAFRDDWSRRECGEPSIALTIVGSSFVYHAGDHAYTWTPLGPVSWFDRDVYAVDIRLSGQNLVGDDRAFFTCDRSGALRIVGYESYSDSSGPAPVELEQKIYDPPPRWLPADLEVGFTWEDSARLTSARQVSPAPEATVSTSDVDIGGSIDGTEVVDTPEGSFDAVTVDAWRDGAWAAGVGVVRDQELPLTRIDDAE